VDNGEDGIGSGDDGIVLLWRPLVQFDSNGGSHIPSQRLDPGGTATEPPPPVKPGFTFGGWYRDRNLTVPFDFSSPVTVGITLYAKWI
jgi:uncharacterized repeat protein (TIGR02543 family)